MFYCANTMQPLLYENSTSQMFVLVSMNIFKTELAGRILNELQTS